MKRGILTALIIIFYINNAHSQQNPSGINWKYIDAGVYRIIFPEEITPAGERMADLMLHYERYNYSSIKTKPRTIPIVLINENADANGFVSPAPFYSHWYTTPSSFDGIEWFRGLAIHEGRHMVQMNKLKDGAGKGAWRVLFGEYGTAAFQFLYIPLWFMEGDAVVMETALTKGGRGRLPHFTLWQRGLELSGKRYSYYKNYLGAYDSLYPRNDHYRLGYLLCSYIKRHYGVDVWNNVLEDTGKYFLFYTFDRSLEFATGKSITELYNDALNEYNVMWNLQIEGLSFTETQLKSGHYPKRFDSYLFPSINSDGNVNTIRFSNDKKVMLGSIDENGKFRKIKRMPYEILYGMFKNERTISAGGDNFLWTETVPDPRWGYKSFLDLKLYNSATEETTRLSHKRRFISSSLSYDGENAVAIEYTKSLTYKLSIFNTTTKTEFSSLELSDTGHIFDPAISEDGSMVALSSLSDEGNSLILYNNATGKTTNLTGRTYSESFRSPVFYGNYIIYISNYSGIDNIYAIDIEKKKKYQVTSVKFGAYYPFINFKNSTLLFNNYTVNGYSVAEIKLNPEKWIPIEKVPKRIADTIEPIAQQEIKGDFKTAYDVPSHMHDIKKYYPIAHTLNFFGWYPYLDSTNSEFSFSLISRDVLQTTDLMISYIRNLNENTNAGAGSMIYSGFYPVFTISGSYGDRAVKVDNDTEDKSLDYDKWKESIGKGGVNFPLDFSRGIHNVSINFGGRSAYIHITDKLQDNNDIYEDINTDGNLIYNEYFFSFSHIIPGALSSVTPGIGEIINITYTHTPYNSDYTGKFLTANLTFYLPGITDTQGFKINGSYEKLDYENYIFPSVNLFPRGYDSVRYEQFIQTGIDYKFPLINFSMNIWKLLYFKRINGDVFFDYGAGKNETGYTYYKSAGFELTAEQNLLTNLYLAVEAGVRYAYCFDTAEHKYEFVLTTPVY